MDVHAAIADPVRRDILELLRSGPKTAGAIAAAFPISRPAISRHVRVLREVGLVIDAQAGTDADGRERTYRLDPTPLQAVDAWLAQFRPGWSAVLDALDTEVRRTRRERSTTKKNDENRSTA